MRPLADSSRVSTNLKSTTEFGGGPWYASGQQGAREID